MFMLVWNWIDAETSCGISTDVSWYNTKEELLKNYQWYKKLFRGDIEAGDLELSAGVTYSWTDIEQIF